MPWEATENVLQVFMMIQKVSTVQTLREAFVKITRKFGHMGDFPQPH